MCTAKEFKERPFAISRRCDMGFLQGEPTEGDSSVAYGVICEDDDELSIRPGMHVVDPDHDDVD